MKSNIEVSSVPLSSLGSKMITDKIPHHLDFNEALYLHKYILKKRHLDCKFKMHCMSSQQSSSKGWILRDTLFKVHWSTDKGPQEA